MEATSQLYNEFEWLDGRTERKEASSGTKPLTAKKRGIVARYDCKENSKDDILSKCWVLVIYSIKNCHF